MDLEKEIQRYLCEECSSDDEPTIAEIARHFYELGRTEGIKGNLEEVPSNTGAAIEPDDRAFHRLECKHNGYGICTLQSGYRGKNLHITVACNGKCRRMKIWDTKHGYKGVEFKILEEL